MKNESVEKPDSWFMFCHFLAPLTPTLNCIERFQKKRFHLTEKRKKAV